jgi:manganese-dependent ADP-ribose/CDP-alcohol diphosphatase
MQEPLLFGIVSDVQYSEIPSNSDPEKRPSDLGIQKLTGAIEDFNTLPLQFVVNLGDLIDRDSRSFGPITDIMKASKAPVWYALGNHDFCGPDYDYGHAEEAFTALGLTEQTKYYFKDIGDWRFILLDTCDLGILEYREGTKGYETGRQYIEAQKAAGAINAEGWNGGLGNEQIAWMLATIDDATAQGKKVIVFGHHGIYPKHPDSLLNDEEVLELLADKPAVKAFINGHNHDGAYGEYKGLPCWTIEGMMDYRDKTAYATAELFDDKLVIHGFGRVASRTISFRS